MSQLVRKSGKYLFFFVLILLFNPSCDEIDTQIPDVRVDLRLPLSIYNELTVPGNSMYFERQGFGGVIVYCELPDSYYAYDAACTHEISQGCSLEIEGILGTCKCCGSKYILSGSAFPSTGPAVAPLKQYNISILGGNTLWVHN